MQPDLVYYIDAIVDLLSLQEGVEVVEEGTEVGLPVPIRYHYCCVVAGFTVWRPVASAWQHQRVPLSDLLQRQGRGKMDRHRSDWRKGKGGKKRSCLSGFFFFILAGCHTFAHCAFYCIGMCYM